jgi:TPR repeat protein
LAARIIHTNDYQQGKTKQAQQWWLTAANANDEYAQFNLASLFLEKNNIKKATYWFQRAKDNNHPQAVSDQFACCPRLCRIMMPPLGLSTSLSIKILKISLPFLSKDNNHPQAPTALDRLKREQGE